MQCGSVVVYRYSGSVQLGPPVCIHVSWSEQLGSPAMYKCLDQCTIGSSVKCKWSVHMRITHYVQIFWSRITLVRAQLDHYIQIFWSVHNRIAVIYKYFGPCTLGSPVMYSYKSFGQCTMGLSVKCKSFGQWTVGTPLTSVLVCL